MKSSHCLPTNHSLPTHQSLPAPDRASEPVARLNAVLLASQRWALLCRCALFLVALIGLWFAFTSAAQAQRPDRSPANPPSAANVATPEKAERTAEELEKLAADATANRAAAAQEREKASKPKEMNFLQLLMDGGPLMIPLILISVLVLSISLERLINLRSSRIIPRKLRNGLIDASEQRFPLEPQELYQMGLRFPSVTSRVLEAMLKKWGVRFPSSRLRFKTLVNAKRIVCMAPCVG